MITGISVPAKHQVNSYAGESISCMHAGRRDRVSRVSLLGLTSVGGDVHNYRLYDSVSIRLCMDVLIMYTYSIASLAHQNLL